MSAPETIHDQLDRLQTLLADKLGVRRGSFARRVQRAARQVPSGIRHDLEHLADIAAMAQNPRLALRLNPMDTRAAALRVEHYLRSIDVADRRKGLLLSMLGSAAFNLLVAAALLVAVLRWRGFV